MAWLRIELNTVEIKRVTLSRSHLKIGRRPYNDLIFDNLAVSGEHAEIRENSDRYLLTDLKSTNGVYVNGDRVNLSTMLESGDCIEIAKYKLFFFNDAESHAWESILSTQMKGDSPNLPAVAALMVCDARSFSTVSENTGSS